MSTFKVVQTSQGDVQIRSVREQDALAFRELRLEALQTYPLAFGASYEEDYGLPDEHWQQRVRDGAGSEQSIIYVAEAAGTLVGMTGIMRPNRIKRRSGAYMFARGGAALVWAMRCSKRVWTGRAANNCAL